MNILYLPLDSRPCNYDWPHELLEDTPHSCIQPALSQMDYFKQPSDYAEIASFLKLNIENADAFVLSVDQLCYGSLIASRSGDLSLETARDRLAIVRQLKKENPGIKIYAFSIIMRASISALSKGSISEYESMGLYSLYSGKYRDAIEKGLSEEAQDYERKAKLYKSKISPETLQAYRFVRERNHAINMDSVALAAEGVFDSLLLLQEDAHEYGFHTAEQRELLEYKDCLNARNVWLHNGADEGGAAAIARCISPKRTALQVLYSGGNGGFIALYEDRPFMRNVESYLNYLQIDNAASEDVLLIHCPKDVNQREATQQNEYKDSAEETVDLAQELVRKGGRVYLLDVAYANGGSLALIYALKKQGMLERLVGYSAWNTASNALGSILAQFILDKERREPNTRFKWSRLFDDGLYLGDIRQAASEEVRKLGEDPLCLNDKAGAEKLVHHLLQERLCANDWAFAVENEACGVSDKMRISISLPWNRLFEAKIEVTY